MKTLTGICERFRLRKEKKNLESFFDDMGGFNSMCIYGEYKKDLPCACGCAECYSTAPAWNMGIPTFSNEEQKQLKGILEKVEFAKKCKELGFGTTENILIDFSNHETIKIYTDLLNNKIEVAYGIHGTEHRQESCISLDQINKKKKGWWE